MAGDSSIVGSASIDLDKIRSKVLDLTGAAKQINFEINKNIFRELEELNGKIKGITNEPHKIEFSINDADIKSAINSIKELGDEIKNNTKKSSNAFDNIDIGKAIGLTPGNTKEIINQLQQIGNSYAKVFGSKSAKIDTRSFNYNAINDSATAVMKFSDAMGQAHSMMLKLTDVSKGNTSWEVVKQSITESFKSINDMKNALSDLEKTAFSGPKALTGEYRKIAEDKIAEMRNVINKLETDSTKSNFGEVIEQNAEKASTSIANLKTEIDRLKNIEWPSDKLAATNVTAKIDEYKVKIQSLQEEIGKFKLSGEGQNFAEANKAVDEYVEKLEALKKTLSTVGDASGEGNAFAVFKSQFDQIEASFKSFKQSIGGLGRSLFSEIDTKQLSGLQQMLENIQKYEQAGGTSGAGIERLKASITELISEYEKLQNVLVKDDLSKEQFEKTADAVKKLDQQYQQLANSSKIYQDGIKNSQAIDSFENKLETLTQRFENYKQKYEEIIALDPSKASSDVEAKMRNVQDILDRGVDPSNIKQYQEALQNLGTTLSGLQTPARSLSQALQQSFGNVGSYLARFVSATYLITKSIGTIKSMVNEVRTLDTSIVELTKVTDLSGDSLNNFVDNAYKVGKEVGRTGKDVVDATTTFSRAGYDLQESMELSKSALVMTNVGVDIPNMESAASDMISILKAFDKQAEESMDVIDKLYNVANKEPLDFGNITQMLVTSGGTLAQTGNSLEQTMGLLTAGFATLRNNSVANGLIQISQRLRGVREDGEAIEEAGFMPKLKKAFGDAGVAIEDENGELRSTYNILNDLAAVWDTLSSKQRQYLGEKAAGNRQVKVLNAIMANWDVVQDTIQKAEESTGAAEKGNEKFMQSIEGRVTQLKSAFSDLARTTINSDFIKWFIEAGTNITKFITDIGGVIPVLQNLLGIILAFNGARIASGFEKFFSGIRTFGAGGFVSAIGLIITALTALSKVAEKNSSFNRLAESKDAYQTSLSTIETARSKLADIEAQIQEIQAQGELTFVDQQELSRLEQVSAQLQSQITLEEQLKEARQNTINTNFADLMTSYMDRSTGSLLGDLGQVGKLFMNEVATVIIESFLPNDAVEYLKKNIGYDKWGVSDWELFDTGLQNFQTNIDATNYRRDAIQKLLSDLYSAGENLSKEDKESLKNYNADTAKASKYAAEQLYQAQAIYAKYAQATEGVERNEATEWAFQILDEMGKQLTAASEQYAQRTQGNKTWLENMLNLDDFDGNGQKDGIASKLESLAQAGKLTSESFGEGSGLENFIELCELAGISAQEAAKHINEMYATSNSESKSGKGGKGALDFTPDLAGATATIFFVKEEYEALTKAMQEQQKTGRISYQTWTDLINQNKDFASVLELTADGYKINTDAFHDFIAAQSQSGWAYAYEGLIDAQKRLNEAIRDGEDTSAIEQEIEMWSAVVREIDSATNALTRFLAAQQTPDEDQNFLTGQKAFKEIQTGRKSGKVGTDQYKSALDYFLGPDWENKTDKDGKKLYKSVDEAGKAAEKIGKRYFGDNEQQNLINFTNDLQKKGFLDKNNKFIEELDGEVVTTEKIAEALGTNADVVEDLIGLWNTYNFGEEKIQLPEVITDEDVEKLRNIEDLDEVTETLDEIQEKKKEVNEQLEETPDDTGLQEQLAGLEKAEEALTTLKGELESTEITPPETLTLDEAKAKIDDLTATIEALNTAGIDIPVSVAKEYNELLDTFPELHNYLQDPYVFELDADDKASDVLLDVENDLEEIDNSDTKATVKGDTDDATQKIKEVESDIQEVDNEHADVDIGAQDETQEGVESAKSTLRGVGEEQETDLKATDKTEDGVESAKQSLETVDEEKTTDIDAKDNTKEGVNAANTSLANINDPTATVFVQVDSPTLTAASQAIDNVANPEGKPRTALVHVELSGEEEGYVDNSTTDKKGHITGYAGIPPKTREYKGKDEEIVPPSQDWQNDTQIFEVQPKLKDGSAEEVANEAAGQIENTIEDSSDGVDLDFWMPDNLEEIDFSAFQEEADANPITLTFEDVQNVGTAASSLATEATPVVGSTEEGVSAISNLTNAYVALSDAQANMGTVDMSDAGGANAAASALVSAAGQFVDAYTQLSGMTGLDPMSVDADTQAAYDKIQEIANMTPEVVLALNSNAVDSYTAPEKSGTVNYGVNSSAVDKWTPPSKEATVTYNYVTKGTPPSGSGLAMGTKRSEAGISLVDDGGGPELIEHKKQGTFELGEGGPRLTYLDEGDVVHTAEDTKKILKRLGNLGSFFRNGLNTTKSIIGGAFATAVSGGGTTRFTTTSTNTKKKKTTTKTTAAAKSAAKKSSGSTAKKSSGKSSGGGGGGSSKGKDAFSEWAAKLFDWAEIRLERLKDITETWLYKVSTSVSYIAKNTNLNSAIKSVTKEINVSTKAYKLYIKQANKVAKQGGLSSAIKNAVKNGTIRISEYDEDTQKKIKEYQKWYEKALKLKKTIRELREQQKELAKQKLDNIIDYYNARINRLGDINSYRDAVIEYYKSSGKEIIEEYYSDSVNNTNKTIDNLIAKRDALQKEFNSVVSKGYIKKESLEWYEYQKQIDEANKAIVEARIELIKFQDTINAISLQNLGWQLDSLTYDADRMNGLMGLHVAQQIDELPEAYAELITNGMSQISNLEEQNKKLREQQQGLDVLSDKYQELQSQIESNNQAIINMKTSQEEWNDAIIDLKIDGVEKFIESLKKTNEEYERQKELQEALEDLERARSQRTQRIFVEGQGFTYQADQDAIKDAQEKIEDVIEDQLLDRLDDLIDALDGLKADTNIYDAQGNLIGTQYNIPQIGTLSELLTGYYNTQSLEPSFADIKRSVYEQIIAGANGGTNNSFNFGNINLSDVNDVDTLAQAIIEQLPNALLQALYRR